MCIHYGKYESHILLNVEQFIALTEEVTVDDLIVYAIEEQKNAEAKYASYPPTAATRRWVFFALMTQIFKRLEERYPGTMSQYIEEFLTVARGFTSEATDPDYHYGDRIEIEGTIFYPEKDKGFRKIRAHARAGGKTKTDIWDRFSEIIFKLAEEMFDKNISELSAEELEQVLEKALVQAEEKVEVGA